MQGGRESHSTKKRRLKKAGHADACTPKRGSRGPDRKRLLTGDSTKDLGAKWFPGEEKKGKAT